MDLLHVIAIAALAALLGFGGGCMQGKHAGASERMQLAAQVGNANASIDACAVSLDAVRQQGVEDLARAQEQAEAGERALEDLSRENLALADQLAEVELQQARARLEPTCRAQLEVELCESLPLL